MESRQKSGPIDALVAEVNRLTPFRLGSISSHDYTLTDTIPPRIIRVGVFGRRRKTQLVNIIDRGLFRHVNGKREVYIATQTQIVFTPKGTEAISRRGKLVKDGDSSYLFEKVHAPQVATEDHLQEVTALLQRVKKQKRKIFSLKRRRSTV